MRVYVIRSLRSARRYVGITKDLDSRLSDHRRGRSKGGQQLGDFEVLLVEDFVGYAAARTREKFLKSGQGRVWLDKQFKRED